MRFDGIDAVMLAYFAMVAAILMAGAWSVHSHYKAEAHMVAACLKAGHAPETCKRAL